MKVIGFFSQKGGAGKTTLAVHVAVAAQDSGARVVVADTDPQRSASVWAGARDVAAPVVAAAPPAEVPQLLEAAKAEGMTVLVLDTAPHAAPEAASLARLCDMVLVPCRPNAFDVAAVEATVRIVKAAGVPAALVLSACPPRAPEVAEARGVLAAYGLPVAPVEITERRAFARAIASGRAVTEFEADGKAAAEVRALWEWVEKQL